MNWESPWWVLSQFCRLTKFNWILLGNNSESQWILQNLEEGTGVGKGKWGHLDEFSASFGFFSDIEMKSDGRLSGPETKGNEKLSRDVNYWERVREDLLSPIPLTSPSCKS